MNKKLFATGPYTRIPSFLIFTLILNRFRKAPDYADDTAVAV